MPGFDWDRHWELKEEPEGARIFAVKMADMIADFIEKRNVRTVADYGCGPTTLLFNLAERFPGTNFYGFDIAESIVRKDKEKASKLGTTNLRFEQDRLPCPSAGGAYDLVTCFATLHYVRDIERAIRGLFKLVNRGGHLIFNYPNAYTRRAYQRDVKPDDEYMKRGFALLLAGENLLSMKKINDILGVRPRRFYSSVRSNVYVSVRKR